MATVQEAAIAYAEAEKHLRLAQVELAKIEATYKSVYEDDDLDFNYLEYRERAGIMKTIIGEIAYVELLVTQAHIDDTDRAVELDIDVGPASGGDDIQARGGGPR